MSSRARKHTLPAVQPSRDSAPAELRPYLIGGTALLLLTLLAFSNSINSGFTLDSRMLLLFDPRIRDVTLENLELILRHSYWWPNGEAGLYRPLTTLSYLINYAVLGNGDHSPGYHLVNLSLHLLNVALVFDVVRRLLLPRASALRTAFATAVLWAVHPVLTESVTNLAGRADLLAGTAVLGGLLLYMKSLQHIGLKRLPWLAALAVVAAAGALSKESAVVLPGVIVLYELVMWKRNNVSGTPLKSRLLWAGLATVPSIGLALWLRTAVLAASPAAEWPFVDNPIGAASFWIGRLTAVKVLGRYVGLAFWPMKLSSDYSYSEIQLVHGSVEDWIACLGVAALIALTIYLYSKDGQASFFFCFAFLTLLPGSNLLFPIGTIMAERLLYLPSVGLVAVAAIGLNAVAMQYRVSSRVFFVLVGLASAGLAARTWRRNLDWQDDLTMAKATVETSPHSFKAHRLLAATLLLDDAANIDLAVAEADKSTAILRGLPDEEDVADPWTVAASSHLAKANTLSQSEAAGQYRESIKDALRSIAVEAASRSAYDRRHNVKSPIPKSAADAYRNLAASYLHTGKPDQALSAALEAKTIDPGNVDVYGQIADAYLAQQRGEEAAIALAEGMFATSNANLRSDLLKLYKEGGIDTEGCAVIDGPHGPALNPACGIVRRDLCAGTARAHKEALRQQLSCPD